jgi:hypothetical protein
MVSVIYYITCYESNYGGLDGFNASELNGKIGFRIISLPGSDVFV